MTAIQPKVFISYSWTSQEHKEFVKEIADRLIADGIEIILDIYDLSEGDDKYAFMEKMVVDNSVTNILIICDKVYSIKADNREAGVGTESQIISPKIYDQLEQSKFIPIVAEKNDEDQPYLPSMLTSRIWLDFSSAENVNANWERLVRLLFGKPEHKKPKLGKVPSFILSDVVAPTSQIHAKFNSLKDALQKDKKGINSYRKDFENSCFEYVLNLRPNEEISSEDVLSTFTQLKPIRNILVDWLLLESSYSEEKELSESIINIFERLIEVKNRPIDLQSWRQEWFEAHRAFAYEILLYFTAALLKNKKFHTLNDILTSHYLLPPHLKEDSNPFGSIQSFQFSLNALTPPPPREGQSWISVKGEFVKRNADRTDLPFSQIVEADFIILLISFLSSDIDWFPQTLPYCEQVNELPFFTRAMQHKGFQNLITVTGITTLSSLREIVQSKIKERSYIRASFAPSLESIFKIDQWNSVK